MASLLRWSASRAALRRGVTGGHHHHRRAMSSDASRSWATELNKSLEETDPDLFDIIEHEKQRQRNSLVLIASENYTSKSVLDALGSVMSNKYSEGYPAARYYGGNEFIDQSENLCRDRALETFGLDPAEWGVNVQSLSGSPANFQAYTAVLEPHDRIMGLDLPHGGHLSHGYKVPGKNISAVSSYFEQLPYRLDEATGVIDYDRLEENAKLYMPKLVVAGASAYSRNIDYARMRDICDQHGAWLLSDMAHISGLVAAGVVPSPFEHSDIVTTTTHKSLRGPRGAMIFFRKGSRTVGKGKRAKEVPYGLEERINFAVFPGCQGGPHNHTISALATALKQAQTPEFADYQRQVVDNCARMADGLLAKGYSLVSGGTDNHLILVDLKPKGVDGARVERVLELASVATNKNTVPGDTSALVPGGIRMGTPALTSRGFDGEDIDRVVDFFDRGVQIALDLKPAAEAAMGKKTLKAYRAYLEQEQVAGDGIAAIDTLRDEVQAFAQGFPSIAFDEATMRYPEAHKCQ